MSSLRSSDESPTLIAMTPGARSELVAHVSEWRLLTLIDALAGFGARPDHGVNRQALTAADVDAHAFLIDHAASLGCSATLDRAGNLFIRRPGALQVAPVATGSHIDTQPAGGRLDGAYGVCAGFEAIAALNDAGIVTSHPIEVAVWANEEGCRFVPGSLGAQAFVAPERLDQLIAGRDAEGVRYADEIAAMRQRLAHLPEHALGAPMRAFVEAHIEQGPVLEQARTPIGIVSGVQGVRWLGIRSKGMAAHAGTTPQALRRDALHAVSALMTSLYAAAERMPDLRITIGKIEVTPASINTVPGEAMITVDMRHPSTQPLDQCEGLIRDYCAAERYGCGLEVERLMDLPPMLFDDGICNALRSAADALHLSSMNIVSGAFHDSVHLAQHCPTAMLFVPSRDGLSHHPSEYTEPALLVAGARVLALALADLAGLHSIAR